MPSSTASSCATLLQSYTASKRNDNTNDNTSGDDDTAIFLHVMDQLWDLNEDDSQRLIDLNFLVNHLQLAVDDDVRLTTGSDEKRNEIEKKNDENDNNKMEKEWEAGLLLLSKILKTDTNDTVVDTIAPHELVLYLMEYSHRITTDSSKDDVNGNSRRRIIHTPNTLLILLACHAIQTTCVSIKGQVGDDNDGNTATSQPIKIRWKRIETMCTTCITLFQTCIITPLTIHSTTENSLHQEQQLQQEWNDVISLTCQYFIPSLVSIITTMLTYSYDNKGPRRELLDCLQAGLISSLTQLSQAIAICNKNRSHNHRVMKNQQLLTSLVQIVTMPGAKYNQLQDVWIHPLRKYQCPPPPSSQQDLVYDSDNDNDNNQETMREEGDNNIEEHYQIRAFQEVTPLICCNDPEQAQVLNGMNLLWAEDGIAILAYYVMMGGDQEEVMKSLHCVPVVYSPAMKYVLFYPHTVRLINLSQQLQQQQQEQQQQQGERNSDEALLAKSNHDLIMGMGITMLQNLLQCIPQSHGRRLSWPYEALNLCGLPMSAKTTKQSPFDPTGLIQLLLNHLVNLSQRPPTTATTSNDHQTRQKLLVMTRKLLQIHTPHQQIECIGRLVKLCPFPFLIPIVLDLLRPVISVMSEPQTTETILIFDILQPSMKDMKFVRIEEEDDGDDREGDNIGLLMEKCETFISVIAILRLLYLHHLKHDTSITNDDAVVSSLSGATTILQDLRKVLQIILSKYSSVESQQEQQQSSRSSSSSLPKDFFRLNLLDQALDDFFLVVKE